MSLDNREIALLICLIFGTVFLIWRAKAYKQLLELIRRFFCRPILTIFGLATGYIAACVLLLWLGGCWQWSNLKTTLIWAGSFALVAVFNYQKIESGKTFVHMVLLEAVGINAFLSFITSSYTFSLPIELALACTLILLVLVYVVSDGNDGLKLIRNVTLSLLILLSLFMLSNSAYHIATGLHEYLSSNTAREFATPILLTSMFLPFLYGTYVYATYQRIIFAFNHTTKSHALRGHILRRLIVGFGLDLAGLEKWRRHIGLFPPDTMSQVDASIDEIRKVRLREKRPYQIRPVHGWLPNHATIFLASASLNTSDYHRSYDGWLACSGYREIGDDIFPNNLAYYVEGDEFVVSKLKLVLNVNALDSAEQAYESFFQTVALLVKSAIPGALNDGDELPLSSDGTPLFLNGYQLALKRSDWPNGVKGGHDLAFTIEIAEDQPTPPAP